MELCRTRTRLTWDRLHDLQEDGPSVVVRSVVKHGAAASSARPPLPGDTLVKVDGYDVRGLGLSQLRPWLAGDEGSVVTLSFEGSNVRYDTSVVRAVTSHGPMPSTGDGSSRIPVYGAQSSPEDDHRYRPSSHYSPGSPRDGWRSPSYRDERHDGDEYDTYAIAPQHPYSPLEGHRSDRWSAAAGSPSAAWRRAPQTSWAAEADKILAEAQAKIEDALHRERLLQETLDMLREKNAVSPSSRQSHHVIDVSFHYTLGPLKKLSAYVC